MDILVTGGTGQVGIELLRQPWPSDVTLHAPDRATLDLADPASIERAFAERRWAAVISAGAFTAVDRAETEVAEAWRVNALAPAILARRSAEAAIPVVHVSTDYVFSGDKGAPYVETDHVAPLSVYGASKEGGEQAVRTANPRHAILRTAWLASAHRTNFLKTMLRRAAEGRGEVGIVSDQRGCPTLAGDLAEALMHVALALVSDPAAPPGTYHFVNDGDASWAEFATAVFAASGRRGGPSARVRAISTAEYPTPARRPRDSRLATDAITSAFGLRPRPWREALEDTVAALTSPSAR